MNYSGIIDNLLVVINSNKSNIIILFGVVLLSCEGLIFNNSHENEYVNPGDWVELFNPTNKNIDIGNWVFKDEDNDHNFTIPANQVMSPGMYLVLCRDTLEFKDDFPSVINFAGDLGFGLSGGGELIRLFDSNGNLVDEVTYDDADPWPAEADGAGPTLELIHPFLDNGLGQNWSASDIYGGTPGIINSVYSADNSNSIFPGKVINEINYNSADE